MPGEDRHVRRRPAPRRPVRSVAQEPPDVTLQRQVPDREPPDPRPVDPRLARRVHPAPPPVGEVPEVVRVAGQDVHLVPRRDEPPDHRPAVILGPADARMIAVGEPGDPHRASPPGTRNRTFQGSYGVRGDVAFTAI